MASLIKNQILKHLSKFAKNLTPDQISVEILRGKSQLENIELNEDVLTEVLELPAWLKIEKAVCNRISVKVPWTRLKTLPVQLFIDEFTVTVSLTKEFRKTRSTSASTLSVYSSDYNSYGFANRVAEGMSLYINTLEIYFTSEMFGGSLMLSRLSVESRSPHWHQTNDLRQTRIRDHTSEKVLIFKQISWQLLRVEASSRRKGSTNTGNTINAPLRLITSQGKCRLVVKKSTIDGSVLSGRIQVILDDILWVATLAQLRSAVTFYNHIVELINKAAQLSKAETARKQLEQCVIDPEWSVFTSLDSGALANRFRSRGLIACLIERMHEVSQGVVGGSASGSAPTDGAFRQFDIQETSYHCYIGQIDLHLTEDSTATIEFPENWNLDGGAVQVTLSKFACDVYPYHLAGGDRTRWVRYKDHNDSLKFVKQLLDHYKTVISQKIEATNLHNFESSWSSLMSQCCVIRIDDVSVYSVSEITSRRESLFKVFCSDREILTLPGDQPLIHAEFTDFYYPSKDKFPVPPGSTHVLLTPLRVVLDFRTIRWLNYVYQSIFESLDLSSDALESIPHRDTRIEAVMPRLLVPCASGEHFKQPKKPTELGFQLSTCIITNCHVGDNVAEGALKETLSELSDRQLYQMPISVGNVQIKPLPLETDAFRQYLTDLCDIAFSSQPRDKQIKCTTGLSNEELDTLCHSAISDVWCLELSPIWIEFAGNPVYYPRPMPFLMDSPITIWALNHIGSPSIIYLLARSESPLKFVLNHYQYVYFLHVVDSIQKFVDQLELDSKHFGWKAEPVALTLSTISMETELNLILPPDAPMSPFDARNETQMLFTDPTPPPDDDLDQTPPATQAQNPYLLRTKYQNDSGRSTPTGRSKSSSPKPTRRSPFPEFPADTDSDAASVMEDSMSVATDYSDDDQFVLLESPEGAPFDDVFGDDVQGRIEEAAEAMETSLNSRNTELLTRIYNEKVSVLSIKLGELELSLTAYDQHSRLTLQSHKLAIQEHRGLTLGQVLQQIQSKASMVTTESSFSNSMMPVRLRIETNGVGDRGCLYGHIHKAKASLTNVTLANLAPFLEDDADDTGLAVRININETTLLIQDEKKPSAPMTVSVEKCKLEIGEVKNKAMFETLELTPRTEELTDLRRENDELRRKLTEAKTLIQKLAKQTYNTTL